MGTQAGKGAGPGFYGHLPGGKEILLLRLLQPRGALPLTFPCSVCGLAAPNRHGKHSSENRPLRGSRWQPEAAGWRNEGACAPASRDPTHVHVPKAEAGPQSAHAQAH